jgi:hypothetical protein
VAAGQAAAHPGPEQAYFLAGGEAAPPRW